MSQYQKWVEEFGVEEARRRTREQVAAWRAKNKEKARESQNAYNAKNRVRVRKNKQEWYEKNREDQQARQRDYMRGKYAERGAHYERVIAYRKANPEKHRAQSRLQYALKHGRVVKPKWCSACGISGKLDAHHADYTKPYDVEWLCRTCHRSRHPSKLKEEVKTVE